MRYQIIYIHPEDEQPTYSVYDNALDIEIASLTSLEDAQLFRITRLQVDGLRPEKLYLN